MVEGTCKVWKESRVQKYNHERPSALLSRLLRYLTCVGYCVNVHCRWRPILTNENLQSTVGFSLLFLFFRTTKQIEKKLLILKHTAWFDLNEVDYLKTQYSVGYAEYVVYVLLVVDGTSTLVIYCTEWLLLFSFSLGIHEFKSLTSLATGIGFRRTQKAATVWKMF